MLNGLQLHVIDIIYVEYARMFFLFAPFFKECIVLLYATAVLGFRSFSSPSGFL